MRIEVAVEQWQQACCGDPFAVGDRVAWTVSAGDPDERDPDALPRYSEDYHALIPEDVPSARITGEVVALAAVVYARDEVASGASSFRLDTTRFTTHPLTSVGHGSERMLDDDPDTYLVTLEIAEGTDLPAYALGDAGAARRRQEESTADLNRARGGDDVGRMLAALAHEVENRYGSVADITRWADREGCRAVPSRDGATAIRWTRSDVADQDGIVVTTGDGSWLLDASPDGVAELGEFIDAVAEGRVREAVRRGEGTLYLLDTEVRSSDRTWTSTTEYLGPEPQGVVMVVKRLWDRVQRGDHTYAPWGAGPDRH
ncbi:MAG: hypothetical protein EPO52_03725 [Herbiconiux sp.]|uniref:DUF6578 domain-containing protein n=1 Tax=Herbiconiux sp. TaxID=1871186 RepID=UPI001225C69E|nr:DUF6578 domain-containing protein [Herbiconiux sp.]TAJ49395.1 MAG: hypothetical protein EPO52_03725 [Herbiconiux sp.]